MKEKILEILTDIDDSVDYENETALVDDQILDSFALITLIGELEDAFGIRITTVDMVPENMNSVDAIAAMVARLQG
ncbi:MAG: acyl carrier protein [Lachnospiraceae bacterium]|nr:acyl carrier protein [Lachnospiraceae bacterium]